MLLLEQELERDRQVAVAALAGADSFEPTPMQENEFTDYVAPKRDAMEIVLHCPKVSEVPLVDGIGDDAAWAAAKPIQTLDYSSQRLIEISAVHDQTHVYMRVTYPDKAASVTHKTWTWDEKDKFYKQGDDREDMFVFKWSMQGNAIDMALRHAHPHVADIWFWKACRSNPTGYFDDKRHVMEHHEVNKSLEIKGLDGTIGYLRRIGDAGTQPYSELFPSDFKSPYLPRYTIEQPQDSRGDVIGKGRWLDGRWTLECQRLLNTNHDDDVQMQQGGQYLLGVACYEMAGTGIDPALTQPLYRTGDVFDRIVMTID